MVVIFEYKAVNSDELDLFEGTMISVMNKNDDGWWEGTNDKGQRGLFPSNYVRNIE